MVHLGLRGLTYYFGNLQSVSLLVLQYSQTDNPLLKHLTTVMMVAVPWQNPTDLISFLVIPVSTCQHIVKKEEKFCLRCQCSYEARNTTLIKVHTKNY